MLDKNEEAVVDDKANIENSKPSRTPLSVALLLVFLSVVCGLALGHLVAWSEPSENAKSLALIDRLDRLEQRVGLIEKREEEKRGDDIAAPLAEGNGAPSIDIAAFKDNLTGLASSLQMLEEKLQKSSETTQIVQIHAETGIATVLAFGQMQKEALSGFAFEKQRSVLRGLVGEETALVDILTQLEPFAIHGVSTYPALQKQWRDLSDKIQASMRQTSAKTWQDRIIVAIENLVSIRALNSNQGDTLSFAGVDFDLTKERLSQALEKAAAFPPDVQAIISDWRLKAEARSKMEALLNSLADYLISRETLIDKEAQVSAP